MSERRAGTFTCWLVGHRFVIHKNTYTPHETIPNQIMKDTTYIPAPFCVRCGASRAIPGQEAPEK